ncbi:PepSY domain-containing protein [Georgenia faecalis]|uniref:PepSY domain-containing protein n=1 Tax=Georgenia faecalis TaxID=2483799 RepID=UPI000FD9B52B|nr:PepSY domain-containing protein [Georgenia faecalis]
MTTPRAGAAGLVAALLVVAACSDAGGGDSPATEPATQEAPTTAEATASETVTDLEPDEPSMSSGDDASPAPFAPEDAAIGALAAAEAVSENGRAYELDRDDDEGAWQVHVAVDDLEREVEVSADGNTVVREEDEGPVDADDRARLDAASTSANEAAMTALTDIQGNVEEIELEGPEDAPVWRVEVRTTDGANVEVRVDAVTGDIE